MTSSVHRSEAVTTIPPSPNRVERDRPPIRVLSAVVALGRCIATSTLLLARNRVVQPTTHVGERVRFANGSSAVIYRETVVPRDVVLDPVALVVTFRLRWIRGRGHRLFRAESLLNTILFVGFPGFVSKLWLAHDETGSYRGVYQWDGRTRAHAYARALWWVLALVSEPASIRYTVIPGCTRADLLAGGPVDGAWWRVIEAAPPG